LTIMTMRLLALYGIASVTLAASVVGPQRAAPRAGLYDADPRHLWNRVHDQFHVRTAPDGSAWGHDTVDPLVWRETRHLLTGASHASALRVLDEFVSSGGERLVRDPIKRAVFQHDLWAIFDWAAETSERDWTARFALMQRLARVMRSVALPRDVIQRLPRNDAAVPALPRDLFDPAGPWVGVGGTQSVVPHHSGGLSRSAFIVLWNLPAGSRATAAYLQSLWSFPQPFVRDESFELGRDGEVRTKLNPALPAIPERTRIALVRMMLLVDDTGVVVPSPIVQSVQLRTFPGPDFAEIKLSRAALFKGASGGLRAVAPDERDFITFSSMGMDAFEHQLARPWSGPARLPLVLQMCTNCHNTEFEPPVTTVRSVAAIVAQRAFADTRHDRWSHWFTQPVVAAEAKSRRYDWGLLRALWQPASR
jgi:hypothetical protein